MSLFQIGLLTWIEWTHVSLERKPSVMEARSKSHCFPVRIEWIFGRKTSCYLGFSRCIQAVFVPYWAVQISWRNTCVTPKKPSMLEAAASSTLFRCENWDSFWKQYFLQVRFLKVGIGFLVANRPIHQSWRNTYITAEKTMYVRSCKY
jgi:hypothetical protein